MRLRAAVALAFAILAVPAGAAAATKPAKPPAFHAVLTHAEEHPAYQGSVEVFSTRGTRVPRGARITSWSVTFGDTLTRMHGTRLPATISHRVAKAGRTWARLTVTDSLGDRTSSTKATFVAAGSYLRPQPRLITETSDWETYAAMVFTVVPGTWNGLPSTVELDFGDGTAETVRSRHGERVRLSHTYQTTGAFQLVTTVTDTHGPSASRQDQLNVHAGPQLSFGPFSTSPPPAVTGSPWNAYVSAEVSNSYGLLIRQISCSTAETVITTQVSGSAAELFASWSTSGPKVVTCVYLDSLGVWHRDTFTVTSGPPFVRLTGGTGVTQGATAELTPSAVLGSHVMTSWMVDPGDGSSIQAGYTPNFLPQRFTYNTVGEYDATYTVHLDDGEVLTASTHVSVSAAPTLDIASPPVSAVVGQPVTIGGLTASHDPAVSWSHTFVAWGDGTYTQLDGTPPATLPAHAYAATGTYTVAVYAYDDRNGYGFDGVTVIVI